VWDPAGPPADVVGTRKVIGPPLELFAGRVVVGEPTFAWWGVQGNAGTAQGAAPPFEQLRAQLEVHAMGYALSWAVSATVGERGQRLGVQGVGELRESVRDVVVESGLEMIQAAVGVAVPFAGIVVSWVRHGVSAARRQRAAEAAYRAHGIVIDAGERSAAQELAQAVRDTAHPGMPAVVAVEDAHLLSPVAWAAIEEIVAGRSQAHPSLVVLTVPSEARFVDQWWEWLRGMRHRGYVREVVVPALEVAELAALVMEVAPRTDPEVARAVAVGYRSPLGVRCLLSMPRLAEDLEVGVLRLGPGDLPVSPASLGRVYEMVWAGLPVTVQKVLCVAAQALPLVDTQRVSPFVVEVVAQVCAQVPVVGLDRGGCGQALELAGEAGWLVGLGAGVGFREPALRDVALREGVNFFSAGAVQRIVQVTVEVLTAWLGPRVEAELARVGGVPDPVVAVAGRWLLALVDPADAKTDPTVQAVAGVVARSAAENLDGAGARQVVLDYGLSIDRRWAGLDEVRWEITEHLARHQWATGNPGGAIRTLTHVAQDTITTQPWLCARLRTQLLHWRGQVPADHQPRGLLVADATAWEQWAGQGYPDSPAHLTLRHEAAFTIGNCGHPAQALHLLQALLPDMVRVLDADHPHTLTTRHNIAHWTGHCGDPAQALHLYRALLPDMVRVLGENHPNTLTTRNNIAAWTAQCGDPAQALHLFRALLPDQVRVLGANHPDTLRTRGNIAYWTGECGDPAQALRLYRDLLPDQVRVLGADHPHTLTTRHNIAYWTAQCGDPAQALHLARALLPDQVRVLGADHPHTQATRRNLETAQRWVDNAITIDRASALADDDDYDAAETLLDSIDPGHAALPDRVRLFRLRAECREFVEDHSGAVTARQSHVATLRKLMPPDTPEFLTAQHALGQALADAGRHTEAIEILTEVLTGRTTTLGETHPHTNTTRAALRRLEEPSASSPPAPPPRLA